MFLAAIDTSDYVSFVLSFPECATAIGIDSFFLRIDADCADCFPRSFFGREASQRRQNRNSDCPYSCDSPLSYFSRKNTDS
jgi:hypothetical protein